MDDIAGRLASYIRGLSFGQVPVVAIDKAKALVLHDLAIAFLGARAPQGRLAADVAGTFDGAGTSTIVGAVARASATGAAFANCVMIRCTRQEDSTPATVHAGAMLVPTALAIGEQAGSSGRDVLTALVAGYDVVGRLAGSGATNPGPRRPNSHLFGAFGVAATACKLMELDEEQIAIALAYAGNLALMTGLGFEDVQYGLTVRNGILAAQLGKARAPAPTRSLEGERGFFVAQLGGVPRDLEARMATLHQRFDITSAILKSHVGPARNHVPALLLSALMTRHRLTGNDVACVTVRRRGLGQDEVWQAPRDAEGAMYSLPFVLGACLVDGELRDERFYRPDDVAVLAAARRVRVENTDWDDRFLHEVEVGTTDSTALLATGGIEVLPTPDPRPILEAHAAQVVGGAKTMELHRLVARLEHLDNIGRLTACLVP